LILASTKMGNVIGNDKAEEYLHNLAKGLIPNDEYNGMDDQFIAEWVYYCNLIQKIIMSRDTNKK